MVTSVADLFSSAGFMPHGMCYLWRPGVLALHVTSDALIALAYFSIPFTLLYFIRKRTDLEFHWMFVCFALFITACGSTHLMEIWTIWKPLYWLSGSIKLVTAAASVATAVLLVRLIPAALQLPSPAALRAANDALEARVAERTAQLESTNHQLLAQIKQREQAEQTLRSNQKLIQTVLDNSPSTIYVKDLEFRYLLVNRHCAAVFKRERDQILGRNDYDFLDRQHADAFRAMDQRALAADKPIIEEELAPAEEGSRLYLSVKVPLHDESGQVFGVCGISTDITELRRADERIRIQAERLSLLDRSTRAIGERQDLRSIFQVAIRSLEDNLLIDFGCICLLEPGGDTLKIECVGTRSAELALDLALTEQAAIRIDQNGLDRCVHGELVYEPDISGSPYRFLARLAQGGLHSVVIAPLSVEENVFGVLLAARRRPQGFASADCEFLRQLSEHLALAAHQAQLYGALQRAYEDLRQTQESVMQQERLRALGQMASGIAHDINNALSPAALYAQSLLERDTSLSQEARDYLTVIQRAIDDVGQTVSRMRMYYRPRELAPQLQAIDLNATLQQVMDLTRARWHDIPQESGIVIEVSRDLASNLPHIRGVEHEIRDALTNLVFNAVDAMPEGGTLTLRTRVETGPDSDGARQQVSVAISDTGMGMSEAVRARCLEPFFTTKGERGSGLGLAMVYGMVQRHDGNLAIESVPGHGTTVRLSFASISTQVPDTPKPAGGVAKPLRILLIDDDPLLLRSLHDVLTAEGHITTTADGGQKGIDTFIQAQDRGQAFEVVISDLGMPKVDGFAVAAAIRQAAPTAPIILLTGWGQRLQREREVAQYVSRVLGKPPRIAELRAALVEVTSSSP